MAKKYEFHAAANVMPLIEGAEFESLVADIKAKGLLQPIVLLGDLILDGRNRYRACLEAGVEPMFIQYEGDLDLFDYVWTLNAERRHLSINQRALAAAEIRRLRNSEVAKLDEKEGLAGEKVTTVTFSKGKRKKMTFKETSEIQDVNLRTVKRADDILEYGNKDLIEAVKKDKISISKAKELIDKAPEVIEDVLTNINEGKEILSGIKPISEAIPDKPKIRYSKDIAEFLGEGINLENLQKIILSARECKVFGEHVKGNCKACKCSDHDVKMCRIWEYRYGNDKWSKPESDLIDDIDEVLPAIEEIEEE